MTIAIFPKRRGFTLAELLVAMAITVILLTLLVSVTGIALDGWRVGRNKVRSARQAKAALDQLSRDFESMVVRSGNKFEWFFVESDSNPPGPSEIPSPNAARMIFFTAATDRYNGDINGDDDKGGDVSTVSYRLFYKDPIADQEGTPHDVFALYRQLVNPDDTFEKLLGQEELDDEYRQFEDDLDDSNNFVCENIFEMSVVFLIEYSVANGTQIETKYERVPILATSGGVGEFRLRGNGIEVDGDDKSDYAGGRVVAIDISVGVLTDTGLGIVKKARNLQGDAKDRLLAKNSYRYSKTILVPQP